MVVHEDNASIVDIISGAAMLEDEKLRVLNHFFDPLHDRPADPAPPGFTIHRSIDWATEINVAGERVQLEDPLQRYSYSDAYDYFYEALTLSTEEKRKVKFGLMFRSIGHSIHHIQDMGQPQHTRNDAHCNAFASPPASYACIFQHDPSHYEEHTNEVNDDGKLPLDITYTNVEFQHARDFWTTNITRPNIGQGMADFSNTNFLTQDSNFKLDSNGQPEPNAEYPLPRPEFDPQGDAVIKNEPLLSLKNEGFLTDEQIQSVGCDGDDPEFKCKIEFYQSEIKDNYPSTTLQTNPWASSLSIFDKYLINRLEPSEFTLNRINFEKGFYPFLIPRAVAYGAGLINHFFRGRLEIEDVVITGIQMEITVKNISKNNQALESGNFELYYDNTNDLRQEITVSIKEGSGEIPLFVDNTITLTADFPADLNTDKEKPFMLVFNAKEEGNSIGQERGVAAINFTSEKEIIGFLVTPFYLPNDGIDGQRLVTLENGQWTATFFPEGVAGNVDWKGQYKNGKPTKVLTWEGEKSRYFPEEDQSRDSTIYQGGHVQAYTPCKVLGAAIRKNTNGDERIVVVCEWRKGKEVQLFERANDGNLTNNIFDPDGWQRLGQLEIDYDLASSWHFNGSGTEAQGMIRIKAAAIKLVRLKVEISSDTTATFTNLDNLGGIVETRACSSSCIDLEEGGECTGPTRNYNYERHRLDTDFGSYIVAVDYDENDQEVLGIINADVSVHHDIISSRVRNEATSYDDFDYDESFTITGEEQLQYGNDNKSINIFTEDGSFDAITSSSTRTDSTANRDAKSILNDRDIVFLDMHSEAALYFDALYRDEVSGDYLEGTGYVEVATGISQVKGVLEMATQTTSTDFIYEQSYGPSETGIPLQGTSENRAKPVKIK